MKMNLMIGFATLSLLTGVTGALSEYKVKEVNTTVKTTSTVDSVGQFPITKTEAPVISGEKNWDVYQGDKLDVLKGVSAKTNSGQSTKVYASSYSTSEVKKQEVTLTARDTNGIIATEIITVNVKPAEVIDDIQSAPTEQDAIQVVEQTPTTYVAQTVQETPVVQEQVAYEEAHATPTWQAYTMYLGGISIPYQNAGESSGQALIDSNRNMIATFGGATVQSPNDGINTHFIGHNPGIFSILFSLRIGSEVVVTDSSSTPSTYIVGNIFEVDDYGTNLTTNENYVDYILDPGTEERITLQTCINQDINLVVVAFPA